MNHDLISTKCYKVDILSTKFIVWILHQSALKQMSSLAFVMLPRSSTEQVYKRIKYLSMTEHYDLIQKELENNL